MASKTIPQIFGLEKSKSHQVDQNMFANLLTVFDDKKFQMEMLGFHAPHEEEVDVQSLFLLVDKTLVEATAIVDSIVNPKGAQGSGSPAFKPPKEGFNPPLAAINEVACQITCKALDTKNVHETISSLFHELSSYSWVTKAVISLSSLALSYGDFWRLAQILPSDELAQPMAILKGLPAITKQSSDVQKIQVYRDLNDIVKTTLSMTRCIVEFEHDSKGDPELSTAIDIPRSVYQIISSVLACSIQFTSLISLADDYNGKYLRAFIGKVNRIYHTIRGEFEDYKQRKEMKIEEQRLRRIFKNPSSNVELIKALISTKHNPQPLVVGKKPNIKYEVEFLRRKKVMLLISDLNLSPEDISILAKMYKEPKFKEEGYEIVWIIDQEGKDGINQFKNLQSEMPWYTVNSSTLIYNRAIKIMKEEWRLRPETTATVLKRQGNPSNHNAMSMIRLLGLDAIPFLDLVDPQTHDINWFELLVTDEIFPKIQEVIKSEKYVLLYGTEDPKAKQEIEGPLKNIQEGIPVVFHCVVNMPLFWSRLESLMHLILTLPINKRKAHMQDILELYTNFKKDRGFAVLTKGSRIVTNDSIVIVTKVLSQYETDWKKYVNVDGKTFDTAFMDFRKQVYVPPRCHNIYISDAVAYKPEIVECPDCGRKMKTYVNFECCHGAH